MFHNRIGIDFFFIDARNGHTYPCGYRGNESLGKYWSMQRDSIDRGATCNRCDWECFRDPSEMIGPILRGLSNPLCLIKEIRRDASYFRLWVDDLRYYRACALFDGRQPPDFNNLRGF